jgi:hypothetical protein
VCDGAAGAPSEAACGKRGMPVFNAVGPAADGNEGVMQLQTAIRQPTDGEGKRWEEMGG